jgi:type VI secretion system protein ImpK
MNEIRTPINQPIYPVNYTNQQQRNAQSAVQGTDAYDDNNQLIRAAEPLLTLITQIRHTVDHTNVDALRAQVIEEVKLFERKLGQIGYSMRTIIAARYCLCTAIDETVLGQQWGTQSVWVQGSLLSIFQKETWGGERFYVILEDALRDIRGNIDFIELIYYLISLGFEGRFYGEEHRAAREEIRNRIFYHIRHARAKPERSLSPHAMQRVMSTTIAQKKSRLKRTAFICGLIIIAMGLYFNIRIYHHAQPTLSKLDKLGDVSPVTTFSQVIERPIVIRRDDAEEN